MSLQARSRLVFIAILGLCILPVMLAQIVWQWARPQGGESYGQLLAQPLIDDTNSASWQLLAHAGQDCTESNHEFAQLQLFAQQLQRAQGRDQARIIVSPCRVISPPMPSGVYLIDPHGNAVLRYSPQQLADVKGRQAVLREISKVLKNNPGLG